MTAAPLQAATLFSDNFDSRNLARWSPVSGAWSTCQHSGQTGYRYCQTDPAFFPPLSLAGDNGWADYSVQATVSLDNDVKGRVGVLGRVHDRYNFYELRLEKDPAGAKRWWIFKSINDTFTGIASGPFDYQRYRALGFTGRTVTIERRGREGRKEEHMAQLPLRGTTFNAENRSARGLAERTDFLCGFREFCVDRRGTG